MNHENCLTVLSLCCPISGERSGQSRITGCITCTDLSAVNGENCDVTQALCHIQSHSVEMCENQSHGYIGSSRVSRASAPTRVTITQWAQEEEERDEKKRRKEEEARMWRRGERKNECTCLSVEEKSKNTNNDIYAHFVHLVLYFILSSLFSSLFFLPLSLSCFSCVISPFHVTFTSE